MKQKVTRRAKRYPVHLEIKELNGQPVADTYLKDISTLGARLESPTPLDVKSQVEFSVFLPDEDSETKLAGVVVWVKPADEKPGHYHMGVELHSSFLGKSPRMMTRPEDKMELAEDTCIASFFGSKGGAGNTFISVNVAYLLAKEKKGKVLVVDLDLLYGQAGYFFDAKPNYTIIDVLENFEHLDSSYMQGLLYKYNDYLSLLPAPFRLDQVESITPVKIKKLLQHLRSLQVFRWILLDCYHQMDEVALTALESSDEIFLVTAPSFTSLSNTKKILSILNLLDLERSQIAVILNSLKKRQTLSESEMVKFLGREINYKIGFEPGQVDHSIDEGQPLGKIAPGVADSMGLNAIANRFLGKDASRTGKRWSRIMDLLKNP